MQRGALHLGVCFKLECRVPQGRLRKNALLRPEGFRRTCFLEEASPDQWPQDLRVKIGHHDIIMRKVLRCGFAVEGSAQVSTEGTVFGLYVDNVQKHILTDRLRSYGAALKELGALGRQETGRWLNNRAENSHLPFRRRERAMQRFRRMRSLQMFVSVHASITNHFNLERSLTSRSNFKLNRTAALAEWRQLLAG